MANTRHMVIGDGCTAMCYLPKIGGPNLSEIKVGDIFAFTKKICKRCPRYVECNLDGFNHIKLYPRSRKSFIDEFVQWFENKNGSEYPTPSYQIN